MLSLTILFYWGLGCPLHNFSHLCLDHPIDCSNAASYCEWLFSKWSSITTWRVNSCSSIILLFLEDILTKFVDDAQKWWSFVNVFGHVLLECCWCWSETWTMPYDGNSIISLCSVQICYAAMVFPNRWIYNTTLLYFWSSCYIRLIVLGSLCLI